MSACVRKQLCACKCSYYYVRMRLYAFACMCVCMYPCVCSCAWVYYVCVRAPAHARDCESDQRVTIGCAVICADVYLVALTLEHVIMSHRPQVGIGVVWPPLYQRRDKIALNANRACIIARTWESSIRVCGAVDVVAIGMVVLVANRAGPRADVLRNNVTVLNARAGTALDDIDHLVTKHNVRMVSIFRCVSFSVLVRNKPPLNRGTVAIPLLGFSHEKDTTHFTPFKWWFVGNFARTPIAPYFHKRQILILTYGKASWW